MTSYADLYSIRLERGYEEEIVVGDLVRTSENQWPRFTVIAIHGERAWVRNIDSGADGLTMLDRCRKVLPATESKAA